ncbi:uncharacterized protein LOC112892519 [Panicum hallii]|uniref:uncharacterized protein LOC112892519 n=1 Tax=Panicum hallii TaxID=206008 RepID=UPI000DF4E7FA|nr:uncharacterized protein LOC112892519 [Panicum hallii]
MELLPPGADRLVALPDDVLVLILEKLGGAREAIRACSLVSRRWSQLPWLLQEPKISVRDFNPRGTELYELDAAELGRAMGAFCRAVSSFLSNAPEATATARCLSLEFFLAKGCLPTVQRLLGGGGVGGTTARKVSAPAARHQDDGARDGLRRRPDAPVRAALRALHGRVPRRVPRAHGAGAVEPCGSAAPAWRPSWARAGGWGASRCATATERAAAAARRS